MKIRLILLAILLVPLILSPVNAGDITINFEWDQADYARVTGWKMYYGTAAGGPYTFLVDVPKEAGGPVFTAPMVVTAPDNQLTTLYFVLTAVDANNNLESAYSNEASRVIDWRPVNPPVLRIIVTPAGN